MGFRVEINSILRSDEPYQLARGKTFPFEKQGSRVFFDTLPIWLTRSDWTALAEIQIVSQTRTSAGVTGEFVVSYVYTPEDQPAITEVFRRLYASEGDPNIYVLISGEDYKKAFANGVYAPASLQTEHFVHASPFNQLTRVANKRYKDVADVRLLVVALAKINPPVKWEPATGGLYPHIYGPVNMDAVVRDYAVPRQPDGSFEINRQDFGG